jgi:hypothetical protein
VPRALQKRFGRRPAMILQRLIADYSSPAEQAMLLYRRLKGDEMIHGYVRLTASLAPFFDDTERAVEIATALENRCEQDRGIYPSPAEEGG